MLAGLGAGELILFVDDDDTDPRSDRNRAAANRLYDRAGFTEIDRLHSYRLDH
jgi:ribosomal protein S18 acetylase RimI-like enzyme